MTDEEFLEKIGATIGRGFQGAVRDFGSDGKKVVKILPRFNSSGDDLTEFINNEIANGMHAGRVGVGPRIYDTRFIGKNAYIVMEKVVPLKEIEQSDVNRVIQIFSKAIQANLVNLDGSLAETNQGKLVLLDYGVSRIEKNPKEALRVYIGNDHFFLMDRMNRITGINDFFQTFSPRTLQSSIRQQQKQHRSSIQN